LDRRDGGHRTSYPEPCPEDPNQRLAINARPARARWRWWERLGPPRCQSDFERKFGHSLGNPRISGAVMARSIGGGAGFFCSWSVMTRRVSGRWSTIQQPFFTAEKGTPPRGIGRVMESCGRRGQPHGVCRGQRCASGNGPRKSISAFSREEASGSTGVIPTHSPFKRNRGDADLREGLLPILDKGRLLGPDRETGETELMAAAHPQRCKLTGPAVVACRPAASTLSAL